MTDRIHSITLILGKDLRVDDVEGLANACRHMRGVVNVKPNVSEVGAVEVARSRLVTDLSKELYEMLGRLRKT